MINIAGLDKAAVLMALYDNARPQGMGFLHYKPVPMTREESERLISQSSYFDYVFGRVLKVDLSKDELDPRLYDRDNGPGAAERALKLLMTSSEA